MKYISGAQLYILGFTTQVALERQMNALAVLYLVLAVALIVLMRWNK